MKDIIKSKFETYRYDISDLNEKIEYAKLVDYLQSKNYKKWTNYLGYNYNFEKNQNWWNKLYKLGSVVEIDTSFLFEEQFNTTKSSGNLRLHLWSEDIYPNKDIKQGYYLESEELLEVIKEQHKCGFCGARYNKENMPKDKICTKCLGSPYLSEDNIKLLRLNSVATPNGLKKYLTKEQVEKLKPKIFRERVKYNKMVAKKDLKERLERNEKEFQTAKNEYYGTKWLLKKGFNVDNIIFYPHRDIFTLGWKTPLTFDEEQDVKKRLKDFKYSYEIIT